MRRRLTVAVSVAVLMAVTGFAGTGSAGVKLQYSRTYNAVQKKLGHRAPGRNIRKYGLAGGRVPTKAHYRRSLSTLRNMLHPPKLVPVSQVGATQTSSASSGGGGGLPACASESGTNYSMGPDNTNPSGASGRYQIMPFHWHTDCAGLDQSPSGQDACAQRIYNNSGAGAWTGCGG